MNAAPQNSSILAQRGTGHVDVVGMGVRRALPDVQVGNGDRHAQRLHAVQRVDDLREAQAAELEVDGVLLVTARHGLSAGVIEAIFSCPMLLVSDCSTTEKSEKLPLFGMVRFSAAAISAPNCVHVPIIERTCSSSIRRLVTRSCSPSLMSTADM